MDESNQSVLSRRQLFFLIVQAQIGIGVLSLPYDLHETAKQDGWIALIIGGLIMQVLFVLYWWLAKRFPNDQFFQIIEKILGKVIGSFVKWLFIIYFSIVVALILLLFSRLINLWILTNTPPWVVSGIMLLICLYLAYEPIQVIARVCTFVSALLVLLLLTLVITVQDLKIVYLFPMFHEGIKPILIASTDAIISMLGFVVLFFAYPYTKGSHKSKLLTLSLANAFVVGFYLISVLIVYTFFSTDEIPLVSEPILFLLKAFELPFISRIDLFFISTWMVSVATSITVFIYMAGIGMKDALRKQSHGPFVVVAGAISFAISTFPRGEEGVILAFSDYVSILSYIFSVGTPVILLILSLILRKRDRSGMQ
ncbi:hypothetical protein N781_04500 [Pontibacillus halophilus JSM 076056 = DSM 19796]|uniref:Spore germination protein (Amino acid permease) n=1 Tax=Pontibacillus halophilus JSM 076056 = DSM 19796 TaxID=1385510 RepID=A0A0A5I6E7_9BACI|nr:endospore germination permease [Pontibacillus halophilus]KGX91402.1 hypothetical protein N781_04500 [Pontibacillus halophilus JSM 076056 = DSM 19796]